jgi:hypothetical protein
VWPGGAHRWLCARAAKWCGKCVAFASRKAVIAGGLQRAMTSAAVRVEMSRAPSAGLSVLRPEQLLVYIVVSF